MAVAGNAASFVWCPIARKNYVVLSAGKPIKESTEDENTRSIKARAPHALGVCLLELCGCEIAV